MNKDSGGHLATRPQGPLLVLWLLLSSPSSGVFPTFKGKRKTSQGKSSCSSKGGQDWLPLPLPPKHRIPVPGPSVDLAHRSPGHSEWHFLSGLLLQGCCSGLLLSPAPRPHTPPCSTKTCWQVSSPQEREDSVGRTPRGGKY